MSRKLLSQLNKLGNYSRLAKYPVCDKQATFYTQAPLINLLCKHLIGITISRCFAHYQGIYKSKISNDYVVGIL